MLTGPHRAIPHPVFVNSGEPSLIEGHRCELQGLSRASFGGCLELAGSRTTHKITYLALPLNFHRGTVSPRPDS